MRTLPRTLPLALLVGGLSLAAPPSPSPAPGSLAGDPAPGRPAAPEERWGVTAVALRRTMDGRMLDFRYRVLDAKKAEPLFDRRMKPYLFDPARGVAVGMPEDAKLGALRASLRNPPVTGKQYYVLFSNPMGRIEKGSCVTVVLGDCLFGDVVVE